MVFWVFGYGSLVSNPGFEYDAKVIGFIKDYRRVFLFDLGMFLLLTNLMFCTPACTDHRGTPESPARTCTLEDVEGPVCVSGGGAGSCLLCTGRSWNGKISYGVAELSFLTWSDMHCFLFVVFGEDRKR
ncbi:hypothetical protein POTOM_023888 [Populus tomentosa]|uniref:Gamma-glutamylcyclotransferase n=1 Tax=Populus tomentosa TaxID=118781 RepID=A0A8X8CZW7_POPTO|nr:hypothetical protein POTOM_023888 [Populus tomentosa]